MPLIDSRAKFRYPRNSTGEDDAQRPWPPHSPSPRSGRRPPPAPPETWIPIGPRTGEVKALAIDPAAPATLYAGTFGGGLYRTTDAGATWTLCDSGLPRDAVVEGVAVDPSVAEDGLGRLEHGRRLPQRRRRLHAGSACSRSSGRSGRSIAVDPKGVAYAAADITGPSPGVHRSADGGRTLDAPRFRVPAQLPRITRPPIDPKTPATLYAGHDQRRHRSSRPTRARPGPPSSDDDREGEHPRAGRRPGRPGNGLGRDQRRPLPQRRLRQDLGEEEPGQVAALQRRRLRDRPDRPEDRLRRPFPTASSRRRTSAATGPRSRRGSTGSTSPPSPSIPRDALYAGTNREGVLKTTDGGKKLVADAGRLHGHRREGARRRPVRARARSTSAPSRATSRSRPTAARPGRACTRE